MHTGRLGVDLDAPELWARLGTSGSTAKAAIAAHRVRMRKFREIARSAGWAYRGALHLRPKRLGWWPHTHLLVFGASRDAIARAWKRAGGGRGEAWAQRINHLPHDGSLEAFLSLASYEALLGYAVNRAVRVPAPVPGRPDPIAEWAAGLAGVRLTTQLAGSRRGARRLPEKRNITTATHPSPTEPGPGDLARVSRNVLGVLADRPLSRSRIARKLTSADRELLPRVLDALVRTWEVVIVPGKRALWYQVAKVPTRREARAALSVGGTGSTPDAPEKIRWAAAGGARG